MFKLVKNDANANGTQKTTHKTSDNAESLRRKADRNNRHTKIDGVWWTVDQDR